MRLRNVVLAVVGAALVASSGTAAAVAAVAPDIGIASDRGQVSIHPVGPPPCARLVGPPSTPAPEIPPCIGYVPGSGQRLEYTEGSPLTVSSSGDVVAPRISLFDAVGNLRGVVGSIQAGPRGFIFAPAAPGVTHAMFTLPYADGTFEGEQIYDVALTGIAPPPQPGPIEVPTPAPVAPSKPSPAKSAKSVGARRAVRKGTRVRVTVAAPKGSKVRLSWRAAGKAGTSRISMTRSTRHVMLRIPKRATRVRVQLSSEGKRVSRTFSVKRAR